MTLRSKFKSVPDAVSGGVWVEYPDAPNKDGTIPAFLIARISGSNPAYSRALNKNFEIKQEADELGRTISEDEENGMTADTFANAICKGWKNFQPEDDGKMLAYSVDEARKLSLDPSWADLVNDIRAKAMDASRYLVAKSEKIAKNL